MQTKAVLLLSKDRNSSYTECDRLSLTRQKNVLLTVKKDRSSNYIKCKNHTLSV